MLFDLRDPQTIEATAERLRAMDGKIPTLKGIEVGIDERPSPRSAHIALLTHFDDWAGLDAYAVHPVHQEVLAYMGTVVERAKKVDWEDSA